MANDFGRKNLYRNLGLVDGHVRFQDVAHQAGAEDYGAGMSATFLDYDNDGRLDIYTGNMWTAAGQRVTTASTFKPDATDDIREIYRKHARGNSLLRNRGNGTFEDVSQRAGAAFGRWAWSSDAFDFDNDGWEDLYVVNGMFTREDDQPSIDVDSFFWRQVVAQSPLARTPGVRYDDGWRATNRLLLSGGSQAQHERSVLLRNDGHGGFDEVSGVAGVDVDQDGRSFAVADFDHDGDADIVLMAPRSSPQLRLFRNDFASGHAAVAIRLTGTKSNRDAIGAQVTVETDRGRFTRVVKAGSGFLSQHSKEVLVGLGTSERIAGITILWPSRLTQKITDVPVNHRVSDRGRECPGSRRTLPEGERSVSSWKRCTGSSQSEGSWHGNLALPAFSRSGLEAARQQRRGAVALRAGRPRTSVLLGHFGAAIAGRHRNAGTSARSHNGRGCVTPACIR